MSTAPYSHMVLLGTDSDFDFYDLRQHLATIYAARPKGDRVRYNSDMIMLSEKQWNLAGDPDRRVRHAHHSFIALDAIRRYRNVYIFDPMKPGFV